MPWLALGIADQAAESKRLLQMDGTAAIPYIPFVTQT